MIAHGPADAALSVGARLQGAAAWHGGRCTWIAPRVAPRADGRAELTIRPVGASLGYGNAGIGLFLAHLYAMTGDPGLRRTSLGAMRLALQSTTSQDGPGLYKGLTGVGWAAARGARLLHDDELLVRARSALDEGLYGAEETDLHHGAAGVIVGQLDARRELEEPVPGRLLEIGEAILERGEPSSNGALSWSTGVADLRLGNLLGMAHGAAGIGMALAALDAETGRSDLGRATDAAARYERVHLDEDAGGWPDLRTHTRTGVRGPAFTQAWCHGTPGVALARLAAGRRRGDDALLREAEAGLGITASVMGWFLAAEGTDFCLCHGLAGNADILLTGFRELDGAPARWAETAEDVAAEGMGRYEARGRPWPCGAVGEVPALLTGSAGIGMFLLRLTDPAVRSVLAIGMDVAPARSRQEENAHA